MKHPVIGLYNMLIRVKVSTKEGMGDCNPCPLALVPTAL